MPAATTRRAKKTRAVRVSTNGAGKTRPAASRNGASGRTARKPARKGAARTPRNGAAKPALPRRILNILPSRDTDRDWRFEHAIAAVGMARAAAAPPSVDLRQPWWKINNQKETGSCVGWAVADSVVRWHFVKAGLLDRNQLVSPRFTWMASKETDEFRSRPTTFLEAEGTSVKAALDVIRKWGSVLDADLPFASGRLFPGDEMAFYALAARRKIGSYYNLSLRFGPVQRWRNWIASEGPIAVRLDVDNAFGSAGNRLLDRYVRPSEPAGHAVALVGYEPDRFILRNSWGTNWGDGGFAYVSNRYAQDAFTEAYGVRL
ncbi:MAG: C1 family peptidase [Dehalococcoidia bacterium]